MEQRLEIGGNNPPAESEILKERLDGYVKEEKLINELTSREVPEEVNSDEDAGELTDFIKSLKSARSAVEKIFKTEKEPFLAAAKVADAWKNVRWLKIDNSINKASKPIIAWNAKKAEEERLRQAELAKKAQEEAELLVKEAEAHASAGIEETANDLLGFAIEAENKATNIIEKSNDIKGRSYGSFGSASTRTIWIGEIEDVTQVDLNLLRKYFSRSDIEAVVNRAVREGVRELKGVKIFEQDKLTIR